MLRQGMLILTALCCFAWAGQDGAATPASNTYQTPTENGRPAGADGLDAVTIPRLLSFQGRLADTLGIPVPNGQYSVAFRLYSQPSGGSSFWNETQNVTTKDGLFTVLLGSVTPVGSLPDAGAAYIGMAVGGGAELEPRLRLVSAAYSYLTERAAGADLLQGKDTTGFVRAGQSSSVTSAMITDGTIAAGDIATGAVTSVKIADGTIAAADLNQMGAGTGQVMKWTGSAWAPRNDSVGGGSGTVTSVGQATGVVCSPNPITTTGTVRLDTAYSDSRYVNEGQSSSVTSAMITDGTIAAGDIATGAVTSVKIADGTIAAADLNQMGAGTGQVMKWTGSAWAPRNDSLGSADNAWVRGGDSVLYTLNSLGIAKGGAGNKIYGSTSASSHVNFGVYCTTGTSGQSYAYITVGGGRGNAAGERNATVSGGQLNRATAIYATVAGGYSNASQGVASGVLSGISNVAGDAVGDSGAVVTGGVGNSATALYTAVTGGRLNAATAMYAAVGGGQQNLASNNRTVIGGGYLNAASGEVAAVGGGQANTASHNWTVVSGGNQNTASGQYAVVSGGDNNQAGGFYSAIGGGTSNRVTGTYSVVAGGSSDSALARLCGVLSGYNNLAGRQTADSCAVVGGGSGNRAESSFVFIGGGSGNIARGAYATVGGGSADTASGKYGGVLSGHGNIAGRTPADSFALVCGGRRNVADSIWAFVGGGNQNSAIGLASVVVGGQGNSATGFFATVAGGQSNSASSDQAAVGGGMGNVASYVGATVAGGRDNIASGTFSTVPGGGYNAARGGVSLAAGSYARANHRGSFVWSDSAVNASESVYTTGVNQFRVRARNGTWIYSNAAMTTGAYLAAGSNSWASACDSATKTDFREVDRRELLEKLAALRVREYRMRDQQDGTRHIGPVAQDFAAAFGYGENNTSINAADADGVLFAAVQTLHEELQSIRAVSAAQQSEIETLKAALERR